MELFHCSALNSRQLLTFLLVLFLTRRPLRLSRRRGEWRGKSIRKRGRETETNDVIGVAVEAENEVAGVEVGTGIVEATAEIDLAEVKAETEVVKATAEIDLAEVEAETEVVEVVAETGIVGVEVGIGIVEEIGTVENLGMQTVGGTAAEVEAGTCTDMFVFNFVMILS